MSTSTAAKKLNGAADRIRESKTAGFVSIDREAGIIRGVRIVGLRSRNGRRYLREALQKAKPLYEGARVYLNHQATGDRRVQDRWGKLINVRESADGGLVGDLQYVKNHASTEAILEAAETFRDIGLSHDSLGRSRMEGTEKVIYEIVEVNSVDLVERPATTDNLWESQIVKKKVLEVLREHRATSKDADSFLTRLAEMADEAPTDMQMLDDAEVEMPAEGTDDDKVKSALRQAIIAILDNPDDSATTMQKIRVLLSAGDKINGASGSEVPLEEESSEPDGDEGKPNPFEKKLEESLARIDSRLQLLESAGTSTALVTAATKLLESNRREVTSERIGLLTKLSEADQKALVKTWPEAGTPGSQKPPVSKPRYQQAAGAGAPNGRAAPLLESIGIRALKPKA